MRFNCWSSVRSPIGISQLFRTVIETSPNGTTGYGSAGVRRFSTASLMPASRRASYIRLASPVAK